MRANIVVAREGPVLYLSNEWVSEWSMFWIFRKLQLNHKKMIGKEKDANRR